MGRFSTTIHVFNLNNLTREQFVMEFNKVINSTGYCSCSQNAYDISYFIAFSKNNKWITIGSDNYENNHERAYNDSQKIADLMNTSSFSLEVIDSDWASINLYTNSTIHDTVVIGRSEDFVEYSPKGKRECWENLLNKGKTWDELLSIWNKNEIFVEDTLNEAASILGIDPKYIFYDFKDFERNGENDSNIIRLFFQENHKQ